MMPHFGLVTRPRPRFVLLVCVNQGDEACDETKLWST